MYEYIVKIGLVNELTIYTTITHINTYMCIMCAAAWRVSCVACIKPYTRIVLGTYCTSTPYIYIARYTGYIMIRWSCANFRWRQRLDDLTIYTTGVRKPSCSRILLYIYNNSLFDICARKVSSIEKIIRVKAYCIIL